MPLKPAQAVLVRLLDGGPQSASKLEASFKLLDKLQGAGLVRQDGGGGYELTPAGLARAVSAREHLTWEEQVRARQAEQAARLDGQSGGRR